MEGNKETESSEKRAQESVESAAPPDKVIEKIVYVKKDLEELKFLVKWKGVDEMEFILAKDANIWFPDTVIRYYEAISQWAS